jgi:hypothetical protein
MAFTNPNILVVEIKSIELIKAVSPQVEQISNGYILVCLKANIHTTLFRSLSPSTISHNKLFTEVCNW